MVNEGTANDHRMGTAVLRHSFTGKRQDSNQFRRELKYPERTRNNVQLVRQA